MAVGARSACESPCFTSIDQPCSSSKVREDSFNLETEAILDNASPRNPRVFILASSACVLSLLVACCANASGRSSGCMPQPLSCRLISNRPPFLISSLISDAPASRLFSSNSLTTDAGRSMTSPAAIWLASDVESLCILEGETAFAIMRYHTAAIDDQIDNRYITARFATTN